VCATSCIHTSHAGFILCLLQTIQFCFNVVLCLETIKVFTQLAHNYKPQPSNCCHPAQITLSKPMKPRHAHSATVFGSGSNFRMVVMFGGMGWSGEAPLAETTLLHLGERQRKQIPPCYFLSVCLHTAYVLRQENSMYCLKYSCFNDSGKETLRVQVPAVSCNKDSCSPCQFKHSLTQSWC